MGGPGGQGGGQRLSQESGEKARAPESGETASCGLDSVRSNPRPFRNLRCGMIWK